MVKKLVLSLAFLQGISACASEQEKFNQAVMRGDCLSADRLLSSGTVDVNARISFGSDDEDSDESYPSKVPPIIVATENLDIPMMNMLIGYGANLNARDSKGNNVLHNLASATYMCADDMPLITSCIKFFIKEGVNLSAQNDSGNTPLAEAAGWSKNTECIEALMLPDIASRQKALDNAVWRHLPKNIGLFLLHGTPITQEHKDLLEEGLLEEGNPQDKKFKKCKSLIMKGTRSKEFIKYCFGRFKQNDKKTVFQIVKGRQIGKKR